MKFLIRIVIICLLVASFNPLPLSAADKAAQSIRFKGSVWFVSSMNLYAIMSEDGKKYHPIKKLPNEFMVDGLEVVVEGKLRDDLVGDRMWGQLLQVVKINKSSKYIGPEHREAIRLLLIRMNAFNTRDLAKLQTVDVVAKGISAEQLNAWIADNEKFTLHYVDASPETANSVINGVCVYSRQHANSMSLFGGIDYTVMKFTLSKTGDGWKFTNTETYQPDAGVEIDQAVSDFLEKAQQKYGTTDLAKWKG